MQDSFKGVSTGLHGMKKQTIKPDFLQNVTNLLNCVTNLMVRYTNLAATEFAAHPGCHCPPPDGNIHAALKNDAAALCKSLAGAFFNPARADIGWTKKLAKRLAQRPISGLFRGKPVKPENIEQAAASPLRANRGKSFGTPARPGAKTHSKKRSATGM